MLSAPSADRAAVICIDSPPYIKPAIDRAVKLSTVFHPDLTRSDSFGIMYRRYYIEHALRTCVKATIYRNVLRSYFKNTRAKIRSTARVGWLAQLLHRGRL